MRYAHLRKTAEGFEPVRIIDIPESLSFRIPVDVMVLIPDNLPNHEIMKNYVYRGHWTRRPVPAPTPPPPVPAPPPPPAPAPPEPPKTLPSLIAPAMRDRDLLRLFTVGGDTFVDVGSQAGAWVFSLAKVFRRVIAVESNPGAAQLLRENLAHDGIGNVEVLEMAASNPLDPVLQGKIDLIRIDVEGFEVEVVRGLLKTIEVNNPGLCVKISNARNEIVIRDMLSLILFPGKDLQGSRSDAPQPHLIYARPT